MTLAVLQFVFLASIIVAAGTALAKCADAIADHTGLGKLVVGSVLLAGATSLPELTIDISAVRLGAPDLAVGDLFGSSLMNLLILAVLDLSRHSRGRMLSRPAAAHALSGLLSIGLTAVAAVGMLTAKRSPEWLFLGVHLSIWVIAIGYVLGVRMVFLDQRIARQVSVESGGAEAVAAGQLSLRWAVAGFVAAAAAILLTGPYLAATAEHIAQLSGLGNTFVGTTFVAVSTSLPELVASLAAVRMGAFDLAVGNIFGSNAFNMILLVPLDLVSPGSLLANVGQVHVITALAAITATTVVIMGQLYQVESRRHFLEPDAWLVIALIVTALTIVYFAG